MGWFALASASMREIAAPAQRFGALRRCPRLIAVAMLLAPAPSYAQIMPASTMTGSGSGGQPEGPNLSRLVVQRTIEIISVLVAGSRVAAQPAPLPQGGSLLPEPGGTREGPLAAASPLPPQPLSPRDEQRRIERQQLDAELAGDPEQEPVRSLWGDGPGRGAHGSVDAGQLDRDELAGVYFGIGAGNSSLWAGADGFPDTP